ncbi:MAG: DUF362 domain-containing protein, partial [Dehalococcoidia bacterium]|nr:DUF362 domain-containing protein [Dehalococcoidia bacterium]
MMDKLVDREERVSPSLKDARSRKATVSIVRVHDYDCTQIYEAVKKGVELIGGLERVIKPGSKVFVKINHLPPPSPPEKGIVTHPVFAEAVLRLLKTFSDNITVGDDITSHTTDGFRVSGFQQMCERVEVRLVNLREGGFVEVECNGHFLDKIYLSRIALDADVIINLPKLKTHSLTVLTGGVKNMYGTVPSGLRTKFHGEYVKSEDFSQVLTDIFSAIRPQLTIMDGIVAMEGEGPASGGLRTLGVVLASQDAVALDAVMAKMVGLKPMDIYTTRYCDERGLGVGNLDNIEVVGERLGSVVVSDFRAPASATGLVIRRAPGFLPRLVTRQLSIRPQVIENQCT